MGCSCGSSVQLNQLGLAIQTLQHNFNTFESTINRELSAEAQSKLNGLEKELEALRARIAQLEGGTP